MVASCVVGFVGQAYRREFLEGEAGVVFQAFLQHPSNFQKKGNLISEGLKSGGGMCWGVDLFLEGGEVVEEGLG